MKMLRYSEDRQVATIALNRPELHNAFNPELISEMVKLLQELATKPLRLLILTGEGNSFCAGADLNWMKSMKSWSEEENFQDAQRLAELFRVLNSLPFPVVGKVQGHALGGGAGLVACCDYVVSVSEASFGFTEARLGLIPAVISPYVVAKIGESAARAYFLSGERFSAERALQINLIHEITSSSELAKTMERVVRSFLMAGPGAAREAKALVGRIIVKSEVEDETCRRIARVRIQDEAQEGMRALLAKEKPHWV